MTLNVLACAYAAAEGDAFTVAVLHRLSLLFVDDAVDSALSRAASANSGAGRIGDLVAAATSLKRR